MRTKKKKAAKNEDDCESCDKKRDKEINCLVNIRCAIGDNGKRMQDELVEFIKGEFAKLEKARKTLQYFEQEHARQSDCWAEGESIEGNGQAEYHDKLSRIAAETLDSIKEPMRTPV